MRYFSSAGNPHTYFALPPSILSAYFAFIKIEILLSLYYTQKTPRTRTTRTRTTRTRMNIVSKTFTTLPAEVCNIIHQYYKLPFVDELIECFNNKVEATRRLLKYHKVTVVERRGFRITHDIPSDAPAGGRAEREREYSCYHCVFGSFQCIYQHETYDWSDGVWFANQHDAYTRGANLPESWWVTKQADLYHDHMDILKGASNFYVEELKDKCRENKIKGFSKLRKRELMSALMKI